MDKMFAILTDYQYELCCPFEETFLGKYHKEMHTLGEAIAIFLRNNRDFGVLHITPKTADELGYFNKKNCVIFTAWDKYDERSYYGD